MLAEKKTKKLYVGTVNSENSYYNKAADTYIHSTSPSNAAFGLFKRYMKKFGKADVTEIFIVDGEQLIKVMFNKKW